MILNDGNAPPRIFRGPRQEFDTDSKNPRTGDPFTTVIVNEHWPDPYREFDYVPIDPDARFHPQREHPSRLPIVTVASMPRDAIILVAGPKKVSFEDSVRYPGCVFTLFLCNVESVKVEVFEENVLDSIFVCLVTLVETWRGLVGFDGLESRRFFAMEDNFRDNLLRQFSAILASKVCSKGSV